MLNKKNFELNESDLDRVVGGTLTEVNQLADAFASKAGTLGRFVADAHSALNSKSGRKRFKRTWYLARFKRWFSWNRWWFSRQ